MLPANSPKKVNVGDGFILDSCEKLLGRKAAHHFTSREALDGVAIEKINATKALLVAGANSLRDDFAPAPGFDLKTLARLKVPVILMGLGHYGVEAATRGMQPASISLLQAILERFPQMSVRCDHSYEYVARSAPGLAEHLRMTSCPVAYAVDGIDKHFVARTEYERVVVTVTDRSDMEKQLPLLQNVPALFPAKEKILALHQDYGNKPLHDFAGKLGYQVFTGERYEDFIALYKSCDLHIGNRLHGHLKSLSLGIRSFLTPFDLRQAYFAESLDFPLIRALPSPEFTAYDFGRFTARRNQIAPVMEAFVAEVRKVIA